MKSILVGNGVDIQFGGKAYSNRFIMSRIIYNARANKYDALFDNQVSGEDVERIFTAFLGYANDVLKGKYDHLHHTDLCNAICDFKSRFTGRNSFENYYDIPLEDWFMLLQIFFTNNPDLIDQQVASKQGFERIVLDAIFNEGRIQNIYKKIGKNVRKFFRSFDTIFTLNYDNNIERLCGKKVYHLHGDFSVLADSENPETIQGFYRETIGQRVVLPGFEHCFCNALLHFSGEMKYKHAERNEKYIQLVNCLHDMKCMGNPEHSVQLSKNIELYPEIAPLIELAFDHPELKACTNYHFIDLRMLEGELHILGISPQNDSHIFRCIDESNVEKVVFYHFEEVPSSLPITKKVEYKNVTTLWKSLGAENPHYNCTCQIPDSKQARELISMLNALSFDPISREDIINELKGIPDFVSDPLCREAIQLMNEQKQNGPIQDENELKLHFNAISQIAVREGILPTAFMILLINFINNTPSVK